MMVEGGRISKNIIINKNIKKMIFFFWLSLRSLSPSRAGAAMFV